MSRHNMNFRVGVCGWSRNCFDADGNQIMTPQELEAAAQNDPVGPCPSGVCVAARGSNLTGVSFEEYSKAREAYDNARLEVLCRGERQVRQADVKQIGDGGEWINVGDLGVRHDAPVHRSIWDVLTGK